VPIHPENKDRYPENWKDISRFVRFERAGGRCECLNRECGHPNHPVDDTGRCPCEHGKPNPRTGAKVVLTTAHLDHTPETSDPQFLRAWCQTCHLHYDREIHAANRAKTRQARRENNGQQTLL
jgi:hypothetical protein